MKVVQVNAVCGFGSTGKICVEISEYLKKNGHECKIFYGNKKSTYSDAHRITYPIEIKIHAFLARLTGLEAHFSIAATQRFIKEIDVIQPDLVHIHNVHGNYLHLTMLLKALNKRSIPIVITLHDCWFFTGKCSHFVYANCENWISGCGHCPQLKADIPSFFFDRTDYLLREKEKVLKSQNGLTFIAVSDWMYSCAKKSRLRDAQIETVYNWVDCSIYRPADNAKRNNENFVILGVSAIWDTNSTKFKDFLKLACLLGEKYKFKLIGKFEQTGADLPGNIEFIKYIDNEEELAQEYSNACVYVHLSRGDSFGKVIVEALACGTPVVCYDNTACSELVPVECGYRVSTGNIEEVATAIKMIQKTGVDSYMESCVQQAMKYEKEKMLKKTLSVYRKSINRR